jgi:SAM-dependent methyltransferase
VLGSAAAKGVPEESAMTHEDLEYVSSLIRAGILAGPVLDIGAQYDGYNCRPLFPGVDYFTADIQDTPGVNYVCDFENFSEEVFDRKFGTVLLMNILEHTFEPLKVADAALSLVKPGGSLVIVTPTIWPIHEMPIDCYRLQPQWYERFAETRAVTLLRPHFKFLPGGPVDAIKGDHGWAAYPSPGRGRLHRLWSRAIHKGMRTFGRGMAFPSQLAIGAVLAT